MNTDNGLIARFMGARVQPFDRLQSHLLSAREKFIYDNGLPGVTKQYFEVWGDHELLYDSSWDWLMPVVEKIESLGFSVRIQDTECAIVDNGFDYCANGSKILCTYNCVINFIKYHNDSKRSS